MPRDTYSGFECPSLHDAEAAVLEFTSVRRKGLEQIAANIRAHGDLSDSEVRSELDAVEGELSALGNFRD